MTAPVDFNRVYCITVAFAEASGASAQDRRCVIWSIFNRLALNPTRYGQTLAGVCVKRMQYSEFDGDRVDNANLERTVNTSSDDPVMLDCAVAYDEISSGQSIDPTNGATHYWDHSIPAPYWASSAMVTLVTENFTFVKNVP